MSPVCYCPTGCFFYIGLKLMSMYLKVISVVSVYMCLLLCTVVLTMYCLYCYVRSPWYDHRGWLGVKQQLSIYLLLCLCIVIFNNKICVVTLPLKLNRSHFLRSVQMSDCWLSFRFWSVAVIPFEDNLPCCLLLLHSSIGDASIRMTFAHVTLKNIPLPLGQLHYIFRDVS